MLFSPKSVDNPAVILEYCTQPVYAKVEKMCNALPRTRPPVSILLSLSKVSPAAKSRLFKLGCWA